MQQENQSSFKEENNEQFDEMEKYFATHLPPRSEVHKQRNERKKEDSKEKQTKEKRKPKSERYWSIRILAFVFMLLPILIGTYLFYREINNDPIQKPENESFDEVEIGIIIDRKIMF